MADPLYEALIDEYKIYREIEKELSPVIANDPPIYASFASYLGVFCIALVINAGTNSPEQRDFINNFSPLGMPEMSAEEYQEILQKTDKNKCDTYLYSEQPIITKIYEYDQDHGTNLYERFVMNLCDVADVFANQKNTYKNGVYEFKQEYKEHACDFLNSDGRPTINREPIQRPMVTQQSNDSIVPTRANSPAKNGSAQNQSSYFPKIPECDGQFWIRVLIPLIAAGLFGFIGWVGSQWGLFLFAIVCFIVFCSGIKANKRRCPNCRAWNSFVTDSSKQIGQKRVKVRRNLNSTYYRTSGNMTFGSRQVFVNADEYTYQETYRCTRCGYILKGTRTTIDDGIR